MEIRFSKRKNKKVRKVKLKWLPNKGAKPSRTQKLMIANMRHRNLFMIGGLGSGKTATAAFKACVMSTVNPGTTVGAVGQSYKAAKKDLFPAIEKVLKATGLEEGRDYKYNRSDFLFNIWAWNGKIQGSSAQDPEILVGDNWSAAVGNEPGLWPEQSYLNLLARVRDPEAKFQQIGLFGTPEGFNWLYKHSVKKYPGADLSDDADPRARIHFCTTHEATWLGDYVEHLTDIYSKDLIDEKVGGQFVSVGSGRVYSGFNRHKHMGDFDFFENAPLLLALDFNVAPGIALICQVVPHPDFGSVMYVHDEIHIDRGSTADVIHEFARRYPSREWANEYFDDPKGEWTESLIVCGDATGTAVHATGKSCYGEVFRVLGEAGWAFTDYTPSSNPPVSDRVAVMNGSFEKNRIHVHPRCEKLVDDFEMVTFIPGTRKIDKKNIELTHMSDGLGYMNDALFGRRAAVDINAGAYGGKTKIWGDTNRPW